ncbi:MAG: MmgE/PrpD family protein [Rhodobacteraceae bacterium]|nr:MmgE/PrpD family protein [Paracoccaceae bacterium]
MLDHARGFAGLMGTCDPDRFQDALSKLGAPWALGDYGLVLKPWPSCGYTHRLMTAALELRESLRDRLADIVSIHARLPDFHAAILPFLHPASRSEALFSIPACVGQALVTGGLTLADSEAGFWMRPEVEHLIGRTRVTADPARRPHLNYDPDQPDELRIELRDGTVLSALCTYPLGASQHPMAPEQLAAKYAGLTSQPAETFTRLLHWPDAPDVSDFFKEFSHATA